jgi:hypothetical protein
VAGMRPFGHGSAGRECLQNELQCHEVQVNHFLCKPSAPDTSYLFAGAEGLAGGRKAKLASRQPPPPSVHIAPAGVACKSFRLAKYTQSLLEYV